MPLPSRVTRRINIALAWSRLQTNLEIKYKKYCREQYAAFALVADARLNDLSRRLREQTYVPASPVKLYLPKASGLFRPWTLLSIEDQIVYQAIANEVADKARIKLSKHYNKRVFSNYLTASESKFFFKRWQDCYREFRTVKQFWHREGYDWSATFDLASFYDTIDHRILDSCLQSLGVSPEVTQFLTACLEKWTTGDSFHQSGSRHGIPQGPLASSLLAECLMYQFDEIARDRSCRALRYMDDIHLLAEDETDLRRGLARLDLAARQMALIPQAMKVVIHRASNPAEDTTPISGDDDYEEFEPPTTAIDAKKQIFSITRGLNIGVDDKSRFKFLLHFVPSTAEVLNRLLSVCCLRPDLCHEVCTVIARAKRLTDPTFDKALACLTKHLHYSAVQAELIDVLRGKISAKAEKLLREHASATKANASLSGLIRPDAEAQFALLEIDAATQKWKEYLSQVGGGASWWSRMRVILHVDTETIGEASAAELFAHAMTDADLDVALAAASRYMNLSTSFRPDLSNVNPDIAALLRRAGYAAGPSQSFKVLSRGMAVIFGVHRPHAAWEAIAGRHRQELQRRMVLLESYHSSDPTAFVTMLDTIMEFLLDSLFTRNGTIGNYSIGNIGGNVGDPNSRFARAFPRVRSAAHAVHEARLHGDLAHPLHRKNGPSQRVTFREMKKLVCDCCTAFNDL